MPPQSIEGSPTTKVRPLADGLLRDLARTYGTPLFVYDTASVGRRYDDLRGFDVVRYAQKANANLALLRHLRALGAKVDAVSAGEVRRALAAGFDEHEIHFTADIFDRAISSFLGSHDLHVNLGSADMIEQYAAIRPGRGVTLRINPGFGHGHDLKVNTGGPHSKHGIWHDQLPDVVARAEAAGLRITGIHMHIGSGSDFQHLSQVRHALETAALTAGRHLDTISTGGGLPIPYRPGDRDFDVSRYTADWLETRDLLTQALGRDIALEVEPGRYLAAECGVLLAEVRATKRNGEIPYVLVDAGFDNLVRPAMYGAYHHISILGRDQEPTAPRAVAGPLCESADLFTQDKGGIVALRELPNAEVGDLLCIHDVGAYASSMASNYNTRLLAAEVLVHDGAARLVRRRQTVEDLLALERGLESL